jgi:hypothetical protein
VNRNTGISAFIAGAASLALTSGTLTRRPVTGLARVHDPRIGNNAERS